MIEEEIGGWVLVGYDLSDMEAEPGNRIQVTLYWQLRSPLNKVKTLPMVTTFLDDVALESHQLGLGNLARYAAQFQPDWTDYIQECYTFVIPSTIQSGRYTFNLSLVTGYRPGADLKEGPLLNLGVIQIQ
jgi:hypothetical protein